MKHLFTELAVDSVQGLSWRRWLAVVFAVLSFLVYASTLFTLPQLLNNQFICERSSVAAAASNVVFGTPLLTVDSGLLDYYLKSGKDPLQDVFDETEMAGVRQAGVPNGTLEITRDGNGVGYSLVATAAFRMFGLHVWALPLAMLFLLACSLLAFLGRFTGALTTVVILYFTVLTAMLFTPLVWNPLDANQIPIAGIRYFSLITILPAFHILLDLVDVPSAQRRSFKALLLLGVQTAIFVVAALVRGSALPLVGAIGLVGLVLIWKHRGEKSWTRSLTRKAAVIGVVGLAILGPIMAVVPRAYLTEGRFQPQIWHRVTLSVGTDPSWPWPGVAQMFDCQKYVPQGIGPGMPDQNGHCMWFDYIIKHHIPIDTIANKTYGGEYEIALRHAFFEIAREYPLKVFTVFIYYKPLWIGRSLLASLRTNFSADPRNTVDYMIHFPQLVMPYAKITIVLLIASFAILLAHFAINGASTAASVMRHIGAVAAVLALATIPAYLAVWAQPYSSADLLFYCLFFPGLAVGAIPLASRWVLRRPSSTSAPG